MHSAFHSGFRKKKIETKEALYHDVLLSERESEVAQSCLTLSDPMDYSPPGPPSMGFSRQEYWSGMPWDICSISLCPLYFQKSTHLQRILANSQSLSNKALHLSGKSVTLPSIKFSEVISSITRKTAHLIVREKRPLFG